MSEEGVELLVVVLKRLEFWGGGQRPIFRPTFSVIRMCPPCRSCGILGGRSSPQ